MSNVMKKLEREANAALESKELPEGKSDAVHFDKLLSGFGVRIRIRRSGGTIRRSWILQYRVGISQRRLFIGDAQTMTVAVAREKARKLIAQIKDGADPQSAKRAQREKDAMTLRSVISDYLAQQTGSRSTLRVTRYYLEGAHFKPLLGMSIDRITRRDIATQLLAIGKTVNKTTGKKPGAPTVLAARSALSGALAWAVETGLIETNAMIGAYRPKTPPSRTRILSDAELAAVWHGVGDNDFGRVIRLIICSACRREEVGKMMWSELDLDAGVWTLPATRTKSKRQHVLPITPLMASILDKIPRRVGCDFVFGRTGFSSWSIAKPVLDERLGLAHWTIHDLRRSAASGMANTLRVPPHVISMVLNHAGHRGSVTGIYVRSNYESEMFDAMRRWSDHVAQITSGTERKTIPFLGGRDGRDPVQPMTTRQLTR
jgi:integrase